MIAARSFDARPAAVDPLLDDGSRVERLNGELSHAAREAEVIIQRWRQRFNRRRPRSALG